MGMSYANWRNPNKMDWIGWRRNSKGINDCCRDCDNRVFIGEPYLTNHPDPEKNQLPQGSGIEFQCIAQRCRKCNSEIWILANHEEHKLYARKREDFILRTGLNETSKYIF